MNLYDPGAVRALLDAHGFAFEKTMGQNFLVDESIPRRIAAGVDQTMGVLEIGPGHGALTVCLAKTAGRVLAVELDRRLLPVLHVTLHGLDNVRVLQGDALKLDLPALCAEAFPGLIPAVCANLPYNITTAAVSALLKAGCFRTLTLMVQKEAGDRLLSAPGREGWGPLPMALAADYTGETLFAVPPESFVPRPHVDSVVLRLTRREISRIPEDCRAQWEKLVRTAFLQRRKTLANGLEAGGFGRKTEIAALLQTLGYDPRIRGEALDVEDFVRLAQNL